MLRSKGRAQRRRDDFDPDGDPRMAIAGEMGRAGGFGIRILDFGIVLESFASTFELVEGDSP